MAIVGTGIDIIEIHRIKKAAEMSSRFLEKVFTPCEIEYFNSRGGAPCHAAGNFAAKEAVLKALGTGLRNLEWKDIEIRRDELGKPYVMLYNNAYSIMISKNIAMIHISISHSKEYAIAQAVAEGGE